MPAGWLSSASFATAVLIVHALRCSYRGDPAAETDYNVTRADAAATVPRA
jgi:hypothetical protein